MKCMGDEFPDKRPTAGKAAKKLQSMLSTSRFDVPVEGLDVQGKLKNDCQQCFGKTRVGITCGRHFICSKCLQSHSGLVQGQEPLSCMFEEGGCQNCYTGEDLKDALPYSVFETYIQRKTLTSKYFENFASAYGSNVTNEVLGTVREGLQSIEESHEARMAEIEANIGVTLDAIRSIQNQLDRSLAALAFLATGETIPCPKLVWVEASEKNKANLRDIATKPFQQAFQKEIDVYFLCEEDCVIAHPSPMTMHVNKNCVKYLIPIIKVSIIALKVAGLSQGIVVPLPDLEDQSAFLNDVLINELTDRRMKELLDDAEKMYSNLINGFDLDIGSERVNVVRKLIGESYSELSKRALKEKHYKKWNPYMDPVWTSDRGGASKPKWVRKKNTIL